MTGFPLFDDLVNDPAVVGIARLLERPGARLTLLPETAGGLGLFLSALYTLLGQPILYLGLLEDKVRSIFGDASLFLQEARFFPMREPPPLEDSLASGERVKVLEELLENRRLLILASLPSVLTPTRSPRALRESRVALSSGKAFPFIRLLEILESWGFHRVDSVFGKREVAVRGGIIDLFPDPSPEPYRVEWLGDEIDSIRAFDPHSQRSTRKILRLELLPPESGPMSEGMLLDYLTDDTVLVGDYPESWESEAGAWTGKFSGSISEKNVIRLLEWVKRRSMLSFSASEEEQTRAWPLAQADSWSHRFREFLEEVRRHREKGRLVSLYTRQASRLREVLQESGLEDVEVVPAPLSQGFFMKGQGRVVYTDHELFGRVTATPFRGRGAPSRPVALEELREGDVVVHARHGIAVYEGLVPIPVEGKIQDYLLLAFEGSDKLYVPLEEMHQVERYVGPEGKVPHLSKLGGQEWKNAKRRARQAAREIAQDLVRLYAARSQIPGHAFSPDTSWQAELEEAFPFVETPDQAAAINDAKKDMESGKPMDRLVLGDVGYGKTEVALRASFKAAMDGRQVAVLVPTTILAQQHYETFRERLEAFPIRVEVLSRFQGKKERDRILTGILSGEVDILIGTHRMLQKDVAFKDLGLLVVDEEQRFGVSHKERLKKLRQDVDVLTLSATPIPRTLYLSLVGVRDISVIETPPEDRLPVKTFVLPRDSQVIARAILQELERGGQVYYLYNRVLDIETKAREIQALVPGMRLAVAHGQMRSGELESVMWEFMKGLHDVLLCTTIIENGLDIPRVNTLIVEHAERFGLADLYQLRGRVGRADRQGYAYFFVPPQASLTEAAQKRLQAVVEYSHLGSGYSIAVRDLEIRGAGNLLGLAQHGHVTEVGFHLYCQILSDEVKKLKGEKPPPSLPRVEIHLPVAAYFPDEYVPVRSQKLDLYRRLAASQNEKDVDEMVDEVIDRYGDPPAEAQNLFHMVRLRLACLENRIHAMRWREGELMVCFWDGRTDLVIPAPDVSGRFFEKVGLDFLKSKIAVVQ